VIHRIRLLHHGLSARLDEKGNRPEKSLNRRQEKALAALLTAKTIKAAAEASKIGETTVHRYLDTPLFQEAYRTARRSLTANAMARLQAKSEAAADCLIERLKDNPLNSVSVRKVIRESCEIP
jgi:hypothetical protein